MPTSDTVHQGHDPGATLGSGAHPWVSYNWTTSMLSRKSGSKGWLHYMTLHYITLYDIICY